MSVDLVRHWRLNNQRYKLEGDICRTCGYAMFPPRDVCPKCAEAAQAPPFPILAEAPDVTDFDVLEQTEALLAERQRVELEVEK